MKNKKTKKGFTLVELLVVITILAVLATVSVIGYRSFTKKAQISNDTSLVAQLNLALKANEATDGKPENPTEVLNIMEENGFNVEKLTPTTSKYNIVWNQEANEFALLNEENGVVYGTSTNDYRTWKFLDQYEVDSNYSVYLKGEKTLETLEVTTGLDVGKNTSTAVTYTNSEAREKVLLRTNEGTLEVNAKNDSVYHYGIADKVVVTAVADHSYDEFGKVKGNIEVAKGHVVVTPNAEVESVIATNNDVKIDIQNETTEVKAADSVDLSGKVEGTTPKTIKYVSTIDELCNAEGEVVLNNDLSGGISFSSGKTIVLDANNHSIKGHIDISGNSNITIKGNGNFSYNGYLIFVGDSSVGSVYKEGGTLTIESGNFTATEACIGTVTGAEFAKSNIIINGGTFTSLDNGVFMSNGSSQVQGANWTINDGTFNGNIRTKGYIAMGMYIANTDVVTLNGGTFNIKNGVGLVCRSGKTTINKDVRINIVNDGTVVSGWAGDSKIELSVASYIIKDEKANYGRPEIINNSIYTVIDLQNS